MRADRMPSVADPLAAILPHDRSAAGRIWRLCMSYAGSAYAQDSGSRPSSLRPRMSESVAQTQGGPMPAVVPAPGVHPGSVIRLARLARGETQQQTGQACGFSQSQISRIESGKAHAYDIRHLARLARHLDI